MFPETRTIKVEAAKEAAKIADQSGDQNSLVDAGGLKALLKSKGDSETFLDALQKVIRFKKSFLSAASEAQPANFSLTKSEGTTTYSVDAALGLQPFQLYQRRFAESQLVVETAPSVEGHVSSDPNAQQNSISGRIPFDFIYGLVAPYVTNSWLPSQVFTVAPVYETDKDWRTKTISLQPLYTPNIPKLGIGVPLVLIGQRSDPLMSFRWRPYVGLDFGRVLDSGGNAQLRDTSDYSRLYSQLHGELWIGKQFELAADLYDRLRLNGNHKNFTFVEVSPTYYLDTQRRFSVGLTYKDGRSTPSFNHIHSLNLWVGLKF